MNGNHFSLILLSTNQCNAACDYCFEEKTRDRLTLAELQVIVEKVLDYMDARRIGQLTIHWQGGEVMLLPPEWYRQAYALIDKAASDRGKQIEHGLQTNLLAYGPEWDTVIVEMFGRSLSTSLDYPNLHRRVPRRGPEHYDALWNRKAKMARAAGIDVKVISVLNQATLEIGPERFYTHLVEELDVTDFQVNTPFPGGKSNAVKQSLPLDTATQIRFHRELFDLWLERGYEDGVRIGPFDQLINYFTNRDACLPCIWGQNCTDELVAIDARGHVAQCDCWVTSYPGYRFGNIFECDRLDDLLGTSKARQHFADRPVRLVKRGCIECEYLALCHGGCPVRAFSAHDGLFEKDPYCDLYKALFGHAQTRAAALARTAWAAT